MTDYAPLFELRTNTSEEVLRAEALEVLERDAKHALKSSDSDERLQGIRAVQLLNY